MKVYKEGRNIVSETDTHIYKESVQPGKNFKGTEEEWNKLKEYEEIKKDDVILNHAKSISPGSS